MSDQIVPPDQPISTSLVDVPPEELALAEREPIPFQTSFQGIMEMYSKMETVAEYLDRHEGWFVRCALPMKAEPFGQNGYTLTIGSYGAFGYQVEPKMSVILEPPQDNFYLMYSVPNPNFNHLGYEVNYQATMNLEEITSSEATSGLDRVYKKQGLSDLPSTITRVNWQLDLQVKVKLPKFIYRLPMSIIENAGDRLLTQIVRQVSPRLSFKVQKDFHTQLSLPIPPQTARTCEHIASPGEDNAPQQGEENR
jgi:hypothetical protein